MPRGLSKDTAGTLVTSLAERVSKGDKENRMPAFAAAGATASSPSESMKRAKPVGEIPKGSDEGLPAMVVERTTSAAEASRAVRRSSIGNLNCIKGRSSLT
ncbi:hypothetical protein BA700_09495 [Corynebacterium stationis]|nr:hypothetical protein AW169_09495 [Corynebacterium stationis]ASJ19213.1 hypothetical protein BA700_09495 [Corynebacterium stationis]